jgi:translation elongation factor EF-1alpha
MPRKKNKKKTRKKPAKKTKAKKSIPVIGVVTHYFPHVKAAVIDVKRSIAVGDYIALKGHTTDFRQDVKSMEVDRKPIKRAKRGDDIGVQVKRRVRVGDRVYAAKKSAVQTFLSKLPFG